MATLSPSVIVNSTPFSILTNSSPTGMCLTTEIVCIMLTTLLRYIMFGMLLCLSLNANSLQAKTVLILGDSLSAAYGLDPQQGWVELLKTELPTYHIVNASVSGETTSGGLKRLPELLNTHQPQHVVVELGANDGLRGQPLTLLRQNLTRIIEQSVAIGANVGLIEMYVPPNYGRRYSERFNQTFHQLATQEHVSLIPFFLHNVSVDPTLIQADGLHPTAEAQPIILANVLPYIQALLND